MADINLNLNAGDFERATKAIQKAMDSLRKVIKKTGTTFKKDAVSARGLAKATKLLNVEKKKLSAVDREQIRVAKRLQTVNAKLTVSTSKENIELIKQEKLLRKVNAQMRAGGKNTASWGKALGSFQFKFNALGNIAANVTSRIAMGFSRAMRDAVKTIKDFDQVMADVKSVSGATTKQFDQLRDAALKLGAVTRFTATQVGGLQKAFAKLGLTTNQILKAQRSTLDFAAATGADLAEAAKVAGVALNAFGLDAILTGEVVATMAVATTKSALAFEDLETILSTVGSVARTYGFTLEETIALTGKLRDAGMDASKSATATRNILLNLADANGALAKSLGGSVDTFDGLIDGLIELNEKGVDLATTLELTDKRSVAAFNQFLRVAESARTLKDEISDVTDELERMVKIQADTLAGDIDLLKSAWDGFILSQSDGGILRNTVQLLTDFVLQVSNLGLAFTKFHKQSGEQLERSYDILLALSNKQGTQFQAVVDKWSGASLIALMKNKEDIIKELGNIRKVNKKEAEALFHEMIQRRNDAAYQELLIEIAKNKAINDLNEDSLGGYEDVSKLLAKILSDELNLVEETQDKIVDAYSGAWDKIAKSTEGTIENIAAILDQQLADDLERLNEKIEEEKKAARESIRIEQEKAEAKRDIQQAAFNFAHTLLGVFSSRNRAALDKDLEAAEDNEKKTEQLKKEFAKKEQKIALASAVMNQAEAITQIWSKWAANPIVAGILTGIALGTLIPQIAIIKNQKFAEGGWVDGKSHSQGGMQIEAERGEYVIREKSASKWGDLIEAINQDDQMRIMNAMHRDRKITINGSADPYNKKIYEFMIKQGSGYEDNDYYYKEVGNTLYKTRKR